jgi:Tol biopolymer transport system component
VSFASTATNLVTEDRNGHVLDVFVRDRLAGTTELVSRATDGTQAHGHVFAHDLSGDGRFVAFEAHAGNLPPADDQGDIFLHDRIGGITTAITDSAPDPDGFDPSAAPSLSSDGRFLVFASSNDLLVPGDDFRRNEILLFDRVLGTISRATDEPHRALPGGVAGPSAMFHPSISRDGSVVTFEAETLLTAGDLTAPADIFAVTGL